MRREVLSTENLEYWQRTNVPLVPLPVEVSRTAIPPEQRRLLTVRAVGRSPAPARPAPQRDMEPPFPTEGLLAGAYNYEIPVAFHISGALGGVEVSLGTWSPKEEASGAIDRRQDVIRAVLDGLYPGVRAEPAEPGPVLERGGFVLGIPTRHPQDPLDDALPIDRLIRAMGNASWSVLVLAQPVRERATANFRAMLINEARAIEAASQAEGAPSPFAEQFLEMIGMATRELTLAQAVGAWRTAVYLAGDWEGYVRLASAWRSIFAGDRSLPEPLRIWDLGEGGLHRDWSMLDLEAPEGPGFYRHPFLYQTLLSSRQLATFVHLPSKETPGFAIDSVPEFEVVPGAGQAEGGLDLGTVVNRGRQTESRYSFPVDRLTRHGFVAGVTGSGKSNTMFHILLQLRERGLPFLVLEPAKTEYRALMRVMPDLQVFTPGAETIAPLRLNPFEVPEGTPVSVHLDLLRSVFAASFGMWTPLPQVLERCLYRIYAQRGWDLTSDANPRLDGDAERWMAWPTLSDLVAAVDEVTRELGYEQRITDDIRAALRTRLDSLRAGGKGRMLDVRRSIPFEELLARPTVLELEGMGDDDDKAFLMGLLFIRLVEHRRRAGQRQGLEHLVVVEEAHRLLARTSPRGGEEQSDPRGKAVETFTNLLAEIRAYGQGVLVADQIPLKLAPEVIKNTNLKIAHRTVADDDRAVLGGSMAMADGQTRALSTFGVGEAAIFQEGDDAPVLVKVPFAKAAAEAGLPTTGEVAARADAAAADGEVGERGAVVSDDASVTRLVEDRLFRRAFARLVLSAIEDPAAIDRLWYEVMAAVQATRPPRVDEDAFLRAVFARAAERLAERRGAQGRWTYSETRAFAESLGAALADKVDGRRDGGNREAFQRLARGMHARVYDPYQHCSSVCTQKPPVCLYRWTGADVIADGDLEPIWRSADLADAQSPDNTRQQTWDVSQDAAYLMIEWPEDGSDPDVRERVTASARRAALCFAQQMLSSSNKTPRTVSRVTERLIEGAS